MKNIVGTMKKIRKYIDDNKNDYVWFINVWDDGQELMFDDVADFEEYVFVLGMRNKSMVVEEYTIDEFGGITLIIDVVDEPNIDQLVNVGEVLATFL